MCVHERLRVVVILAVLYNLLASPGAVAAVRCHDSANFFCNGTYCVESSSSPPTDGCTNDIYQIEWINTIFSYHGFRALCSRSECFCMKDMCNDGTLHRSLARRRNGRASLKFRCYEGKYLKKKVACPKGVYSCYVSIYNGSACGPEGVVSSERRCPHTHENCLCNENYCNKPVESVEGVDYFNMTNDEWNELINESILQEENLITSTSRQSFTTTMDLTMLTSTEATTQGPSSSISSLNAVSSLTSSNARSKATIASDKLGDAIATSRQEVSISNSQNVAMKPSDQITITTEVPVQSKDRVAEADERQSNSAPHSLAAVFLPLCILTSNRILAVYLQPI